MKKQLFLIGSSKYQGGDYLAHVIQALGQWLGPAKSKDTILCVPLAVANKEWEEYTRDIRVAFEPLGYKILMADTPVQLEKRQIKAIFVGDGNIFRLKYHLEAAKMLEWIKQLVLKGVPYIGSGAGALLACPTIMTTVDTPILEPDCFDGLSLYPWQLNTGLFSHKLPVTEFHKEWETPIVALRASHWMTYDGELASLYSAAETPEPAVVLYPDNHNIWWPADRRS